ncbi:MAG: hypothetical protein U0768_06155 [Anaerolineae bacterium]
MQRLRTAWINLVVLVGLLAVMFPFGALQASADTTPQTPCPGNLLVNPGFEEGSRKTEGEGTSLSSAVASGWSPWLLRGDERDNREPEYKLEDTNLSPSRYRDHSGRYSQKWFTTWGTHTAGIYQQVPVTPGDPLTFSIWTQVYTGQADGFDGVEFRSDPKEDGRYRVWVGIDPTGAVPAGVGAPPPDTVIWSDPVIRYDDWIQMAVSAPAKSDKVTVYVKGQPEFSVKHNDSFWDDACLMVDASLMATPGKVKNPIAPIPTTAQGLPLVAAPANAGADFSIPGGHFYTQTANGKGGFRVVDSDQAKMWTEFQRYGGIDMLGYPISSVFVYDTFPTQVFQKHALQWRPDLGMAVPMNLFDLMSAAGRDPKLLETRQVPLPLVDFDKPGDSFENIVKNRQALLDQNPAMKALYFAAADPLIVYGLPTSKVEDMGNHYAMRTQRAVLQQWREDMPWAKAGQVTVANGGTIAAEVGSFPATATTPEPLAQ